MSAAPNLPRQLAFNAGAAVIDLLVSKIAQVLAFAILVRLLGASEIAAVGVATSYLVVISYLDVAPIRVLLRDYPRLARDPAGLGRLLAALTTFWFGQSIAMLLVCGLLQATVVAAVNLPGIRFVFLALVVDFMGLSLREWIKTIFFAALRQGLATRIAIGENALRLASFTLLVVWPSLETYGWILIASAVVSGALWIGALLVCFDLKLELDRGGLALLWHSLADYGLWDHLNRMVVDTLLLIDTAVLSWAVTREQEIAEYAIALRVTSLLFLVPMQLGRALQIALATVAPGKRDQVINSSLKLNALISIGQLLVLILFGDLLLIVLFGEADPIVFRYTAIIAVGVTGANLGWPLMAVVNNSGRLGSSFRLVFLPLLITGVATYAAAAALGGALWLSYANIAVYAALTTAVAVWVARYASFSPDLRLVTEQERAAVRKMLRGRP